MGREYRVDSAEQRGCVRLQGQESSKYLRHMNQTGVTRAWVYTWDEVCRVTGSGSWRMYVRAKTGLQKAWHSPCAGCRERNVKIVYPRPTEKLTGSQTERKRWLARHCIQFSQLKIISLALCTIIQIVYRKSEQIERLIVHQHHFLLLFLNRISLKRFRSFRRKYW